MPKYLSIHIPEPCHQNWDNMTVADQGRYCNACAKTVIDFSVMTDAQLLSYFKKDTGNTCGRFDSNQLENDILIPKKQIPWLRYFFTITIPAFLLSMKATGQKKIEQVVLVNKEKNKSIFSDTAMLQEVVVISNGSNRHGRETGGAVSYRIISKSSKKKNSTAQKNNIKSEVNQSINIFPNPISANQKLNITWANDVEGIQIVEIFSSNGSLAQKENIAISAKTKTAFVMLKNLPKGLYFFSIINFKTNEKISKEFIIQ